MIVPDSNLLLHAYNLSSPFHVRARRWWEASLSGDEPVGLTHPVLFAFLRISTTTRAAKEPFTLDEAAGHVASWTSRTICRLLHAGPDHVSRVIALLVQAGSAGGNLVTDAQIAALALAHNATVHTADHDFDRFLGLACHFPLES